MDNRRTFGGLILALLVAGIGAYATRRNSEYDTQDAGYTPLDLGGDDYNATEEGATVNWKINDYAMYASTIAEAERRWSIPTDLYARQLYQESRFKRDIINGTRRSPVGAMGIAQFMPDTGRDYGLVGPGYDNRTDPYASIEAGAHYMHDLYNMFHDWRSALMAYNWGPGRVQKYNRGELHDMPMETSNYVAQITADVPIA